MHLFRRKSLQAILEGAESHSLKRTLTATDLILLGIGCIIGTGIFVLTGIAAAKYAGPAVMISYALAGLACIFAALAYTELAAMVPVAGSAYTYAYSVFGELIAWMVGWGLILEYAVGASTVAVGWSGYMTGILQTFGVTLPDALIKSPSEGGFINLPATLVVLFITSLLVRGTKESATLNRILVTIKLCVVFVFLVVAAPHVNLTNWEPFMPFGWHGVIAGASTIFFAYIGFDAVATAAEECKNPNRDLPIGIIGSLLICSVLYVVVSGTLTAIVPYTSLNNPEPLASALRANGSNIGSALVATGAIAGITTVLLVLIYGQTRIFFVMARDKLLPGVFSKLHSRFHTPYLNTLFVGTGVAMVAGFTPITTLGDLASMGTLFAFIVVSIGVLVLRIRHPELARPFRCPLVYIVSPLAVISCSILLIEAYKKTGYPFVAWILIGAVVYISYGYWHSPLRGKNGLS